MDDGCSLSFANIEQFIDLQRILKDPILKVDFEQLRNFDGADRFTVRSGKYTDLSEYKTFMESAKAENLSCQNHSLNGGFEIISGNVQGMFRSWEHYRHPVFNSSHDSINVNADGSF